MEVCGNILSQGSGFVFCSERSNFIVTVRLITNKHQLADASNFNMLCVKCPCLPHLGSVNVFVSAGVW